MTRLRRLVGATLPAPCNRCTLPVLPTDTWDLDHVTSLDEGGAMWSLANLAPAHASCNRAHGASLTNAKRSRSRRRLPPPW